MTWAVQKRGAVFTSSFLPLVQVFVALIDFAVLRETLFFGRYQNFLMGKLVARYLRKPILNY
jgi:hypothetical protein